MLPNVYNHGNREEIDLPERHQLPKGLLIFFFMADVVRPPDRKLDREK